MSDTALISGALTLLTIGFGLGAILGGWWSRRKDRNLFIDELVKLHQQKLILERESAEWHRRYERAAINQRVDVYHHQDECLPGDEWKDRG